MESRPFQTGGKPNACSQEYQSSVLHERLNVSCAGEHPGQKLVGDTRVSKQTVCHRFWISLQSAPDFEWSLKLSLSADKVAAAILRAVSLPTVMKEHVASTHNVEAPHLRASSARGS